MASATTPVRGWEERVLAVVESAFGTTPDPAGAQALEAHNVNMGPAEMGVMRPQRDKWAGRGMTNKYVEGRVQPIEFSLVTAVKSRAAATTVPKESPLYKAAGLVETVGGANVVYSVDADTDVPGLSLYSALGAGTEAAFAEQGFGGVVKGLTWTGGDTELLCAVRGAFAGKHHLGQALATVADDSDTSVVLDTPAEAYRMGLGWYHWESEIVKVTAIDYSTGTLTMTRGVLSSTAAAHTSKPLTPYSPSLTLAGSPIPETDLTVTLDGNTVRATKFSVELETGVDHLPGESGSSRVQGNKLVRCSVRFSVEMVLTVAEVAWLNKVKEKKAIAATIACGSGTGGVATFSMPYSEAEAFPVPKPDNDISIVTVPFRTRDNSGNDLFSLVLT